MKHERSCLTTLPTTQRELKIRRTCSTDNGCVISSIYGKSSRQFQEEYRLIRMSATLSSAEAQGSFSDEENPALSDVSAQATLRAGRPRSI